MPEQEYSIDFFRYRIPALLVSVFFILAGLFEIYHNGLRYSVDFTGGILVHLHFAEPTTIARVRESLGPVGLADSLIQEYGSPQDIIIRVAQEKAERLARRAGLTGEVSVEVMLEQLSLSIQNAVRRTFMAQEPPADRHDLNNTGLAQLTNLLVNDDPLNLKDPQTQVLDTSAYEKYAQQIYQARMNAGGLLQTWEELYRQVTLPDKLKSYLEAHFYLGPFTIMQTEFVGPQVGRELKEKTRLAIGFALLGLLAYIWIRFDLLFGVTAIICLMHDFLITLSAFALTGREISLPVVAAFLTIIGYSLNDTIVVYDRIRENRGKRRYADLYTLYNASLNQVLSRTLLTSLTTLFVVATLYVFGGEVINDFAFALLVGIIVGTYSSIYVASSLAAYWQEFRQKKIRAKVKTGRRRMA